jgi:hypothetical protein
MGTDPRTYVHKSWGPESSWLRLRHFMVGQAALGYRVGNVETLTTYGDELQWESVKRPEFGEADCTLSVLSSDWR